MEKDIPGWSIKKLHLDIGRRSLYGYKPREVWWASVGHNVGYESCGKGADYARPVLIVRGFGIYTALVIPLTSKNNTNARYKRRVFVSGVAIENYALINQIRVIDTKRLLRKIGTISNADFSEVRKDIVDVITQDTLTR